MNANSNIFRIMKLQSDICSGLAASILLHAFIFIYAALARPVDNVLPAPALQAGESAVTLMFVSVRQTPEPAPPKQEPTVSQPAKPAQVAEDRAIIPEEQETPPEEPVDEDESREPEQTESPDADMLPEGVLGNVHPESEIRPRYPLGSRMRGEEGAVTLSIKIVPPGSAERIEVTGSSGYPALDRAATRAVERARFLDADGNKVSTESSITLVFRFQLVD